MGACHFYKTKEDKANGIIKNFRPTPVFDIFNGEDCREGQIVKAVGLPVKLSTQLLHHPFTGEPCIWYNIICFEEVDRATHQDFGSSHLDHGTSSEARVIWTQTVGVKCLLSDGKAHIALDLSDPLKSRVCSRKVMRQPGFPEEIPEEVCAMDMSTRRSRRKVKKGFTRVQWIPAHQKVAVLGRLHRKDDVMGLVPLRKEEIDEKFIREHRWPTGLQRAWTDLAKTRKEFFIISNIDPCLARCKIRPPVIPEEAAKTMDTVEEKKIEIKHVERKSRSESKSPVPVGAKAIVVPLHAEGGSPLKVQEVVP